MKHRKHIKLSASPSEVWAKSNRWLKTNSLSFHFPPEHIGQSLHWLQSISINHWVIWLRSREAAIQRWKNDNKVLTYTDLSRLIQTEEPETGQRNNRSDGCWIRLSRMAYLLCEKGLSCRKLKASPPTETEGSFKALSLTCEWWTHKDQVFTSPTSNRWNGNERFCFSLFPDGE